MIPWDWEFEDGKDWEYTHAARSVCALFSFLFSDLELGVGEKWGDCICETGKVHTFNIRMRMGHKIGKSENGKAYDIGRHS